MPDVRVLYLAGPMTGLPQHNFPAFMKAAERLRHQGYTVFNPAENPATNGIINPRSYYMRLDIFAIIGSTVYANPVDGIAVLPDWFRSRGARLEVEIGLELGVPIFWAETMEPLTEDDWELAREFSHPEYFRGLHTGVAA